MSIEKIVVVLFECDDGVYVIKLPKSEAETEEGQRVLQAITGKDVRYSPYINGGDEEFQTTVHKTLGVWIKKYGVARNHSDEHVIYGTEYN